MKAHEVDYKIYGDDMQVVEVELDHGETVVAEAGVMNWMEDGVAFETKMGDGSQADEGLMGKLLSAAKRTISGESIFMTHFTNGGGGKRRVAFAAPYPGKIIAIDLAALGGELLCQKDAFLCAALGTGISIAFTKRFGAGLFGG
ncbi:MAG: AIM24 family protein, partial [Candidatus Aminicenantes bacterium]|nr:AIM24 family protein [Candidatus Aminicenantes bacterium]